MLFIVLILLSFIISIIINRGFGGIENKEIQAGYLIVVGFAIQIAIFNDKFAASSLNKLTPFLYIISLIILLIFLLLNINYKGILISLTGFLLNFVAILANGGYMPQDLGKLKLIGETGKVKLLQKFGYFYNARIMNNKTHLNFLGDRIVLPFPKSISSVYSIGDIIIVIGICLFIFEYMTVKK